MNGAKLFWADLNHCYHLPPSPSSPHPEDPRRISDCLWELCGEEKVSARASPILPLLLAQRAASAPSTSALPRHQLTLFPALCRATLWPAPTEPPNYPVIYLFVRGFKWPLVSHRRRIGEVRRSGGNGSFIANVPSLSWTEKRKEIKSQNFVVAERLAEAACLAALRSAAACVSGIVLEAGVQKQQGAEDKQAVRDSLNTATVASAVEGCEDPCSNRPITPPHPPPVPAGAGIWPPHASPRHTSD